MESKKNHSESPSQTQLKKLIEQYQSGQYEEAEKLATSIAKQFPTHQLSWQILGVVFSKTGKKSEALDANRRAVHLVPNDAQAHYNLAVSLKELTRLDEAEASYKKAIILKPDNAEAHYNLAVALKELGRLDEAEASYKKAIILKSDYTQAYNNLGIMYQELGKLDEAEASYKKAIIIKPDFSQAHRHLASVKKFSKRDDHFLQMQELLNEGSYSEEQRCHFNFALAKASEDLGEIENAFSYYKEGNILRKKLLNYDITRDIKLFEQIKKCYPKIKENILEIKNTPNKLTPIFIVGMFRSGTTLVEQVISSHSKVAGAGELTFAEILGDSIARGLSILDKNTLLNFRENYIKKLQALSNGSLIVTDKNPQNFRYIGLLATAFPDSKIVHVRRNSAAVCWGNYKQFFASKNVGYPYDLTDVVEYHTLYENLMEFWKTQLADRIYNFDYELLTTNQESETKNLIQYLGLDWEEECLSPQSNNRSVATASNKQIREKIYQGSSQQWKVFKPFLNGVLDHLDG
ncbi:MAG: sulfotransferase [Methylophilaceae bacterium]|nr:sulfotransferase [Methylophilaceae bacterium]